MSRIAANALSESINRISFNVWPYLRPQPVERDNIYWHMKTIFDNIFFADVIINGHPLTNPLISSLTHSRRIFP